MTEYKPAGSDITYVAVPASGCWGCAFDSGNQFTMTAECLGNPGCAEDANAKSPIIWVEKLVGYTDRIWKSDPDLVAYPDACEFDKGRVEEVAASMRPVFDSNDAIEAIDLKIDFDYRLLIEVVGEKGAFHREDRDFDEFDYAGEGWYELVLTVKRDGDVWLTFMADPDGERMEIMLVEGAHE